ncbi:hypothetical protein HIM_07091 [Hirsutella minnesotensis 3608]|uniref:C2H2 type master regulator of conidiophore development brlA n=1 Tax=Hirsutella minnesotensis 3608 TaxID=1043627 RepID=A0A0F7ZND0_9HYPO|nr:hypothetical protein HIM_07091 [Hirsutella minnesotensis 3608]
MDPSHAAYHSHASASDPSAHGVAPNMLNFDTMMGSEPAFSQALDSFGSGVQDDSCFVNNHHQFRLSRANSRLQPDFASLTASKMPAYAARSQAFPGQAPLPSRAAGPPSLDENHQIYTWDNFFNDSALENTALQAGGFNIRGADDCAECDSVCDGSCPSQCGDPGHGVCCDDDACGSPQLCLDESCQGASRPCTDENCLSETPLDTEPMSSHAMTDRDKAAAAALASFGENQLNMMQEGYVQPQTMVPDQLQFGDPSLSLLPQSLPCDSLSMESMFNNGPASFPNQPLQMSVAWTLATHIMQHHDPSHGLAHTGTCVANDPAQFISRCTLPKFYPNDHCSESYLAQMQAHDCGFQVQDPNAFAHHVLQEHKIALLLQAKKYQVPGYIQSQMHDTTGALQSTARRTGSRSTQSQFFSPAASPSTNMSLGPSLPTPSTLATPSPLGFDVDGASRPSSTKPVDASKEAKSSALAEDDQYVCRWLTGDSGCICGKRFDDDEQLQKHCKLEHLKQLDKTRDGFRCGWANCTRDTCFTQRSKLERHMQVHTGYKPVHCRICGAALSAKQALDQHMRIHTGETPWVCTFPGCGCSFKQQSALTMHERTHTGDKPLECEICHKRFSESSNLSKHRRTHNVKGLHECLLCHKDFHRLDQLRRHMSTNHKDRPAEVDALLNGAKPRSLMKGVSKSSKANAMARARTVDAETLEMIGDQLCDVFTEQDG